MLADILTKVAAYEGAKDIDLNPQDRLYLLNIINQAAEEIYESKELPGCLRECYVRVLPNKQIALPPFVGKLRAIREYTLEYPWDIKDLRPRYHYKPWENKWTNWRFIGFSPICVDITNSAPFTYEISTADSTVYLDVVGSTLTASRAVDRITMSATSVVGSKSFNNVHDIRANKPPSNDITIKDGDGNVIALLYNDRTSSLYAWYDVAQYPNIGDCSDGSLIMEILYKLPLQILYNDSDSFPVPEYDSIIADKSIQLLLERQDGKEEKAILAHKKIEARIQEKIEDNSSTHVKPFKVEPDCILGMFRSTRYVPSRRMSKR